MRSHARGMTAGFAGAALVLGLLVGPGGAADEKGMPKDVLDGVTKVATDLEKGKAEDAKKEAALLKSKDLKFPMRLFKLRKSHGFGIGDTAGAIEPDGIERKFEGLAEEAPTKAALVKEGAAIALAGYRMAAIAAVAQAKPPAKDEGAKKTIKNWMQWSKEMHEAGIELAAAAKKQDGAGVQKAAKAAQTACTNCHDAFRDE